MQNLMGSEIAMMVRSKRVREMSASEGSEDDVAQADLDEL